MTDFALKTFKRVEDASQQLWGGPIRDSFSLGGLSWKKLMADVWTSANDDDILDKSAELAYYFFFALFPALIFLSSMFGIFVKEKQQLNHDLMVYLAKVIPPIAFSLVDKAFTATTKASNTGNLAFGAITALWSATYGMSSAQSTLNVVYRTRETRPIWKAKLIAVTLTLVLFALVCAGFLLLTLGDYLAKLLINDVLVEPAALAAWKAIQVIASLFFVTIVFSMTYRWGPSKKNCSWRWITPGAVVGIIGWLAISTAFRIYLRYFNNYTTTYGAFGAVIILLTWFYISGLMLLLGAEINATIERANEARKRVKT
ncbi:MAG TPA: YihY/virulence factor BrkB family protein [Acidobacteriaceae bacterium]|nr:YihY/virulence factor BrkB family protein [Acidobacteriaceae bacterium]